MSHPYVIIPSQGSDPEDDWVKLGVDAQVSNPPNLPLAQQKYNQALRLNPRHVTATNNLALVFAQSNMMNEALLTIERATIFCPDNAILYTNWALMAMASDRLDEALTAARKAVEIDPKDCSAKIALAMALTSAGCPNESIKLYDQVLEMIPNHPLASPNSCFIQTLADGTTADLLSTRKRWYEANKYTGVIEKHKNNADPERVIRVGYVSGDFKSHSASFIFSRVLLHHNSCVEMYLYSTLPVDPKADGATKKFMDAAGQRWRDISMMNDEDAAALIRKDKIDILIDLAGHTNGGRLTLFTRKPAPVQATAWGFAHGTGVPEIDYFMADQVAVREEEYGSFAEKIVNLPCLLTMEEPIHYGLNASSKPPLRKNGYLTFGTYARYEKMSDECIKTFGEIIRRVPDSKLEFKDNAFRRPYCLRRIMNLLPDIDPSRLLFSIQTSHPEHMLAYQQADICLDPFPHGGGVVSLEQLYMGVPVLTMYGKQPGGRNTTSILVAMGRTDWIARDPQEYIEKAVEWSGRTKEIADARLTLRKELLESKVVVGYVEAVEAAYREMWRKWCES